MGDNEETPAGRYLKRRMAELGFKTKAEVADHAKVSRSTLTRLTTNPDYRPDIDVMRRLAGTLQVDPDVLVAQIYGDEASPPPTGEGDDLLPLLAKVRRLADSEHGDTRRWLLDQYVQHLAGLNFTAGVPIVNDNGITVVFKRDGGKVDVLPVIPVGDHYIVSSGEAQVADRPPAGGGSLPAGRIPIPDMTFADEYDPAWVAEATDFVNWAAQTLGSGSLNGLEERVELLRVLQWIRRTHEAATVNRLQPLLEDPEPDLPVPPRRFTADSRADEHAR